MVKKGRKEGTVRFVAPAMPNSREVCVAGDFTEWKPQRMRKQKNGAYAVTLPLNTGRHQYKFLVDDAWMLDPENDQYAVSPIGTTNSVASLA